MFRVAIFLIWAYMKFWSRYSILKLFFFFLGGAAWVEEGWRAVARATLAPPCARPCLWPSCKQAAAHSEFAKNIFKRSVFHNGSKHLVVSYFLAQQFAVPVKRGSGTLSHLQKHTAFRDRQHRVHLRQKTNNENLITIKKYMCHYILLFCT